MRRFIYFMTCSIIIGCVFYLVATYQNYLQIEGAKVFAYTRVYLSIFLFPIFMGMVLRLPKLILEIKKAIHYGPSTEPSH